MTQTTFSHTYLEQAARVASLINRDDVEALVDHLVKIRERSGRLFCLGVGGSAGNASHAVNDFRKICGIECYAPTDNVSELTARTNDEGWETVFSEWLRVSQLGKKDGLLILSVGGGNLEKKISVNLVSALKYAKEVGATICGIVGRDGGFTKKVADACLVIPTIDNELITPHTEAFQSVICHCLVSHPKMKRVQTKWESL